MEENQKMKSFLTGLLLIFIFADTSWSDEKSCFTIQPYESPEYTPPPLESKPSKAPLVDNGDDTISDPASGLMWTKSDSYSDLGKCLTWNESNEYISSIKTGKYTDWRIPTIKELTTLYDNTKENVMAWDHDPRYPLALDKKFADGAAYWYWSSDCGTTELTACCSNTLYFVNGLIQMRRFELCNNGGVRGVRNIK